VKHLVRLYPKRWRDRYAAEITALVQRERASVGGVIDLLRGAIDARLHPALAQQLVFVPTIGFRPRGTRTLLERAETTENDTHLTVLAVAASPERTDMIVEWERTADPAVCTPGSAPPPASAPPPDLTLSAALIAGATRHDALTMERSAYNSLGWAIRTMTFPPLPPATERIELRISDGLRDWRVPFRLVAGHIAARPIAVEAEHEGIRIRATAVAWDGDALVVALEAEAARSVRMIGRPASNPPFLPGGGKLKIAAGVREAGEPIVLEDDRGRRTEEVRRLYSREPQQNAPGQSFVSRLSVAFAAPSSDATGAALVVPFVEITDLDQSVVAALRTVPVDLEMGEHRFRIVSVERYPDSDERRVTLEIPLSSSSPRFIQPASVQGTGTRAGYAWGGGPWGEPGQGVASMWMSIAVGDPPIVTFRGAVLRYDGPWRLELPLS
jgi:hypothetical protein